MAYNPFDKSIGIKIDFEDLKLLVERNVSEGYYIEYKQDFPYKTKIADLPPIIGS